ncbi:MAG: hypothetical protein HGB03_00610 [Candidatus Yonathbacteria bacterium]|nr:hypothetical protein [Candidatus Yonathbacteria bacterium]NTW47763.1 hypothetical protein [Candidatus Yonathbacteria bacterium]
MKNIIIPFLLGVIFLVAFVIYNTYSFSITIDTVFLTITTFFFAILTGFFISRQGTRYGQIRQEIANFDGNLSSIYRTAMHLSNEAQERIGIIIKKHYLPIVERHEWDYHFTHETSTLTDIHRELEASITEKTIVGILSGITLSLRDNQLIRKRMVALHEERIPMFQWTLIFLLATVLIVNLSLLSSVGIVLYSVLKAVFVVAVIAVIILLYQLDSLKLFKGFIGERSATDLLDIIEGKK